MTVKPLSEELPALPRSELLAAVRRLGDALDQFDDAAARTLGVGRSDLRALNLLEHGPLSAGELGERLGLTSGSVTILVDRLIKAGYVTRQPGRSDRRTVQIQLETATYAAFARVYAPCGRAVAELEDGMSVRQITTARKALGEIAAAISEQGQRLQA